MKMTTDKFAKMFKLEIPVWEVDAKLSRLFVQLENDGNLLENEAKQIAKRMSGTLVSHQGMQDRMTGFSGLTKLINKHMAKGWTVKEIANGDGYSTYIL